MCNTNEVVLSGSDALDWAYAGSRRVAVLLVTSQLSSRSYRRSHLRIRFSKNGGWHESSCLVLDTELLVDWIDDIQVQDLKTFKDTCMYDIICTYNFFSSRAVFSSSGLQADELLPS